jgi:hypothetical protein
MAIDGVAVGTAETGYSEAAGAGGLRERDGGEADERDGGQGAREDGVRHVDP